MKFYVDFDDCLCETGRAFTVIAERLFGKVVPYEEIRFFDLQDSFELSNEDYAKMMIEAHRPEILLSYEEAPGASCVLNEWIDEGHEVFIITGRPADSYEASRKWLDEHGLERVKLYCLNKYGREFFLTKNPTLSDSSRKRGSRRLSLSARVASNARSAFLSNRNSVGNSCSIKNSDFNLELEDYYKMEFDYAIEDSPMAFKFFDHLPDLKVMVYDRPWNRECELPSSNYSRCIDWNQIKELISRD